MSPSFGLTGFEWVEVRNRFFVVAPRNEQYYEAILSIWNQLYINVKSLIAWQYCVLDLKRINTLTVSMVGLKRS